MDWIWLLFLLSPWAIVGYVIQSMRVWKQKFEAFRDEAEAERDRLKDELKRSRRLVERVRQCIVDERDHSIGRDIRDYVEK